MDKNFKIFKSLFSKLGRNENSRFDETVKLPFFSSILGSLSLRIKKLLRKSQNDLSKVPTRCNLLPETGYECKDRSTPSGSKFVNREKKKINK